MNHQEQYRIWVDQTYLADNNLNQVLSSYNNKMGGLKQSIGGVKWDSIGHHVYDDRIVLAKQPTAAHIATDLVDMGTTPETYGNISVQNRVEGKVFWDWYYTQHLTGDITDEYLEGDKGAAGVTVYLTKSDSKTGKPVKSWKIKTNSTGGFMFVLANSGLTPYGKDFDIRQGIQVFVDNFSDTGIKHAAQTTPTGLTQYEVPIDIGRGSSSGSINNVNRVLIPLTPQAPFFEIVNYDAVSKFASPGDTAVTMATGWNPNSGTYQIRWDEVKFNADGSIKSTKMVELDKNLVPSEGGVLPEQSYTVPADLKETTLYKATLLNNAGTEELMDSFIAVVPSATTPIGAVGADYAGQVNPMGIAGHAYKYTVDPTTPLPGGLTIDENTGEITGKPTTAGAYPVKLIVKGQAPEVESNGVMVTPEPYSTTIDKTIYILDGNIVGPAMENTPVDPAKVALTITGKDALPADYNVVVTSINHLPVVVTFENEVFGGAPAIDGDDLTTTHEVAITYKVTYPDPQDKTKLIADIVTQEKKPFVVLELLAIKGPLSEGKVGTDYTATPTVVGGEGPYTYSATGLPDGLTIDATTGEITGKPTTKGDYPVKITVTDKHGYKAVLDETVTIADPIPSREPIDLKQDVKKDATGTQVFTGKVGDFTTGEATLGWTVKLTDANGNVLTYTDPADNQEKDVTGTVSPDGTFEFNIENKGLAHEQIVKVQLAEPDKMPTVSTEEVVLDLQGPIVTEIIATLNDGVIEIAAKADDAAAGYVVQVGTKIYPATVDAAGNITAIIDAVDQDEIKIIGVDTLGNLSATDVERPTEPLADTMQIHVNAIYAGNRRVTVYTDKPHAEVTYSIIRDGDVLQTGTFTTSNVGRAAMTLTNQERFAIGDELFMEASATAAGKLYKSEAFGTQITD